MYLYFGTTVHITRDKSLLNGTSHFYQDLVKVLVTRPDRLVPSHTKDFTNKNINAYDTDL